MGKAKANKPKAIETLAAQANLLSLQLLSSAARRGTGSPPPHLRQPVSITYRREANSPQLGVMVSLTIVPADGEAQSHIANNDSFMIGAEFGMIFEFPSLKGVGRKTISEFGQQIAMSLVWPSWQELVHWMVLRMGLPPLKITAVPPSTIFRQKRVPARKESAKKQAGK